MTIHPCLSSLEKEQAFDIRRSVLCGELHMNREAAQDEDDGTAYLAIAWEGEKPVGTGRLLQRGAFWQVEHLCVLPEQRKAGIGRSLLEHFLAQAQARGSQELVAVSPVSAQAFFHRLGFSLAASQGDISVLKRPIG
jgi:N-acetylglutamate synthase-like GNAT family acetyltransferase